MNKFKIKYQAAWLVVLLCFTHGHPCNSQTPFVVESKDFSFSIVFPDHYGTPEKEENPIAEGSNIIETTYYSKSGADDECNGCYYNFNVSILPVPKKFKSKISIKELAFDYIKTHKVKNVKLDEFTYMGQHQAIRITGSGVEPKKGLVLDSSTSGLEYTEIPLYLRFEVLFIGTKLFQVGFMGPTEESLDLPEVAAFFNSFKSW